jgi:hypothetical protein
MKHRLALTLSAFWLTAGCVLGGDGQPDAAAPDGPLPHDFGLPDEGGPDTAPTDGPPGDVEDDVGGDASEVGGPETPAEPGWADTRIGGFNAIRGYMGCESRLPEGGLSPTDGRSDRTVGAPSRHASYCGASGMDGSELAITFVSDIERDVRIVLRPQSLIFGGQPTDMDLVVAIPSPTRDSITCVASSVTRALAEESVLFRAKAGQEYWLIVDSPSGQEGHFWIYADCGSCLVSRETLPARGTIAGNTGAGALSLVNRYARGNGPTRQTFEGQVGFEEAYRAHGQHGATARSVSRGWTGTSTCSWPSTGGWAAGRWRCWLPA